MKCVAHFLVGLCLSGLVFAADNASNIEEGFLDSLGRSTPRGAITGYLTAVEQDDLALAGQYLDLRNLPRELKQYTPSQLALGLSIVLERSSWLTLELYSNDEQGDKDDGLPSYRDMLAEINFRNDKIQLYLQRVPGENGQFIWKVSNATIATLPALYDEYRYTAYVEWLYETLPSTRVLGVQLFKWVTALSITLLASPFVLLLAWFLSRLIVKPGYSMHKKVRRFLMGPFSAVVLTELATMLLLSFGGADIQELTRTQTLATLVIMWFIYAAVDLGKDIYATFLIKKGRAASIPLLHPLASAVKCIFLLLGLLVWLDNIGYSITALLTGLGVGGIAVALVLQKPLEDVFGAITLYTQQPIKIGDFGMFGDRTGTVEEISLRTTRIRTLDNTVVAVPNMLLASRPIENYSVRQKILYKPSILLRNTTRTDQIQQVINGIRQLLDEDEMVLEEGARVTFYEIGAEGLELKVFAYVNITDYPSYLAAAEILNFGILGVIEEAGVELQRALVDVLK